MVNEVAIGFMLLNASNYNLSFRSLLNPEYENLLNSIRKVVKENGHSTSNREVKST